MKHYEITINNGNYPLTYQCSTIAEAFGCLMEVSSWASHVRFDPDEMMGVLVDLHRGVFPLRPTGFVWRYRKGRYEVKPEIFDSDRVPVYENPNRVKDPRRYIRQCLDVETERSRRFTRFVKKLLLVSMALFLLALLLGAAV